MKTRAKKETMLFPLIWLIAVFAIILAVRTTYAQDITTITSFTLKAAGNFTTPNAGDPITYPKDGFVSIASSEPAVRGFIIDYTWWDTVHKKSYYQELGETGVFTPGEWYLTMFVKVPDSDTYRIDATRFNTYKEDLEEIHLGGKEFHVGSIGVPYSPYVGYATTFIIKDTVVPPQGKTLTYNGKTQTGVAAGSAYTITGNTGKNAGEYTARLTLKDKEKYQWSNGKTTDQFIKWKIEPEIVTPQITLSPKSYTFDGNAKKPSVTVKVDGKTISSSAYSVVYRSNKNVGKAAVSVRLKGNYYGTKIVYFKINPKGTKITSVKSIPNGLLVKWKKQTQKMAVSRITGYQIQIAADTGFKKISKTINVRGYNIGSRKITGLKPGKRYYLRIRTYKTVSGQNYYSTWSKWAR